MSKLADRLTHWLTEGPLQRWPWLLPAISFATGWLGFALVQRGEAMARAIAAMALLAWPWLLAENVLGTWLVRMSSGRLSPKLLAFVTQSLQQEVLFFALPFLIGATQRDLGQILFYDGRGVRCTDHHGRSHLPSAHRRASRYQRRFPRILHIHRQPRGAADGGGNADRAGIADRDRR